MATCNATPLPMRGVSCVMSHMGILFCHHGSFIRHASIYIVYHRVPYNDLCAALTPSLGVTFVAPGGLVVPPSWLACRWPFSFVWVQACACLLVAFALLVCPSLPAWVAPLPASLFPSLRVPFVASVLVDAGLPPPIPGFHASCLAWGFAFVTLAIPRVRYLS